MPVSDDKKVDVAVKYLELARAEILYRVKSSNDTLIVYAGAVGAISAWLYKSFHDVQPGSATNDIALSFPPLPLSAGLVVSFLALTASWIVFHNEKMVFALAKYQREELNKNLRETGIISWECSKSLHEGDPRLLSVFTSMVYALLVVGPGATACYEMWSHHYPFSHPWVYLVTSAVMSFGALVFMFLMVVERWKLRI